MSARNERFTFLVNSDERDMIAVLARRWERSQGDVLRILLRDAIRQLDAQMVDPSTMKTHIWPLEKSRNVEFSHER